MALNQSRDMRPSFLRFTEGPGEDALPVFDVVSEKHPHRKAYLVRSLETGEEAIVISGWLKVNGFRRA